MFYSDSLTVFLAGLVLCLFLGDRAVLHTLWHGLRPKMRVPLDGPALERACALGLAFIVLIVRNTDLTVLLLAVLMVVLGGRTGNVFLPFWGIPALVLYGVYPSLWGALLLLPVLFWPGQKRDIAHEQQCLGALLSVGLSAHITPFQPGFWTLGAGSVMMALSAWGYMRKWAVLSGLVLVLRPLFLLGVMMASQKEGLTASAQAAACALLLDLTLSVVRVIQPSWRLLALSVPPLPGFMVTWLGIHATLGLVTGAGGWTLSGLAVAVILALLATLELIRFIPTMRATAVTPSFLLVAALVPSCVMVAGGLLAHHGGYDGLSTFSFATIWSFQGGDGAVLAFPALWGLVLIFWGVFVRPWSLTRPVMLPGTLPVMTSDRQRWLAWLGGETPSLPWRWRRQLVVMRYYGREGSRRFRQMQVPVSEMSLTIWLVFLGAVLALLGLSS
ncbi:hypothetical protein [Saccharibacter floricola]|uniref:hypothetical protein n=1 Tax=Saccharibacter floricola TaxID=231053 RepID=UPI0003721880|nr:hypothetical protein [Saccharibacter floricola]